MATILDDKLTESELAEELGRGIRTIRLWRSRRTGPPFIRLGRQILYRRQAVQDWLASLEQEQPRARRSA
ncbi:helix-turn-helix transcriptional regulator [Salinisphaera hydrothermalis]|uniref:helix-turn-helix transcriptional regulator n=1 Tax=Salinisphaera hydrothermalis TaxID=563188 RepID=UPI00333EA56D